jgi:double-stranded uracil-DNA glycosylase
VNGYEPGVLVTGLAVIFCGINPASSCRRRPRHLEPKQPFWTVLHEAGFTDVRLRAEDERQLL